MSSISGHSESSNGDVLRDRAIRLFKFLRELALLKSKIVRDLSDYENVVWFGDLPEYKNCFSVLISESDNLQDSIWLEIKKGPEPGRPPIPLSCGIWLQEENEEDDLHLEPQLRNEITIEDNPLNSNPVIDTGGHIERLSDHPEILQEWERWKRDEWKPWLDTHIRWEAIDEAYFQLFSIHQQLKKLGERYELLLGLGLLTWETPNNQIIRRHIVVGDAQLSFDAYRAKFELQAAPEGVKLHLETDMVEQSFLPSLEQLKELEDSLSSTGESPWNKEEIEKILKSFINSISSRGVYSDSLQPPDKPSKVPQITFAPAIILRSRTQRSLIQCLNSIIEKIVKGGVIPSGIQILCKEPRSTENDTEGTDFSNFQYKEENIYLPLPTNEEQKQIIYQIKSQNGILVQGPPGTGKSHTIANIICHLLAEGKRVLVTSQTPRALRVLKEKIPKETQALCVTLLGNDQVARQELENSVYGINQKFSDWNPIYSSRSITEQEDQLYKIKKRRATVEKLLREHREVNTYKHSIAGGRYQGTAQVIAQMVANEESTFCWLKDNVGIDTTCPISRTDFKKLVSLCREMPENYCDELRKEIVPSNELPDVVHFIKIIDDEKNARIEMAKLESRRSSLRYRIIQNASELDLGSLHKAISDLIVARRSIRDRFAWIEQATLDISSGNDTPWNNLHDFMTKHLDSLNEKVETAQTLDIQLSGNVDRKKLRSDANDLLVHLKAGGGMGWNFLSPRVVRQTRYITREVKVNGQYCKTLEQLTLLVTYLEAIDEIELLWSAFQGKDKREEGSLLIQAGYLRERSEALDEVLRLKSLLDSAQKRLKAIPDLPEPRWEKIEDLEELVLDIRASESERTLMNVTSAFEQYIQKVRIAKSSPNSNELNHEIQVALEGRDYRAFGQCLEKLKLLEQGRAALHEREALDAQLKLAAPVLEHQLINTYKENFWDERITNFESAWAWKNADNWVNEFGREHDEIVLEASLKQLTAEEQSVVSRLAAAKAWDNCLKKLTAFQRSNLIAWATAMRRMPKTLTAKTRPKWLRQAQECMDNCRGAIPAWIMPLYRVFETIPPDPECFDVVIIDEASQTGPEGLILQYLAKQIIVVGDSEQISPEAIGVPEDEIDALVKRHLEDIPFKRFYTPTTSLFAFAEILFSGKIVLREHFRCMPEIIQFSNQLCYTGTPLKPLRQYPPNRLEPILLRHVKDGFREGSLNNVLNRPEADALVENVLEICTLKQYAGKTIGVISLQGEAQAKYIESKLLSCLSPTDLEDRKIICGDAYAFQGDERDIMFLSLVAAPNERIGVLNKEADKRRFNVAASRAKDQVILFHTATLSDLHPECMRYKLLEYYLNPTKQVYEVDLAKCESQFERDVCQAIIDKGYKAIPQYKAAEYRIDIVLEGSKSQLAVECDGDEWHGSEYYERDMARQRILERCGWRFWRIRGHEYYRNPVEALTPLWRILSDIGIQPCSANSPERVLVVESQDEGKLSSKALVDPMEDEKIREHAATKESKPESPPDNVPVPGIEGREAGNIIISNYSGKSKVNDYPPQFFFKLAHFAKEGNKLEPWERSLIFKIGTYLIRGWQISEKMERQAIRIIQIASRCDMIEAVEKELENSKTAGPKLPSEDESINSLQDSFTWFYEEGLKELLMAKSPIQNSRFGQELVFLSIDFQDPAHTADDCRLAGLTYTRPLFIRARLCIEANGEIKDQDIHLADIPMITTKGTFIINGLEKSLNIYWINNRSLKNSPIDISLTDLTSTAIDRMSIIPFDAVNPSVILNFHPFREAIDEFFNYSDVNTDNKIHSGQENNDEVQEKLNSTIRRYREDIKLNPNNAKAHFYLGDAYYNQGRYYAAIGEFRETLSINTNFDGIHEMMGNTYKAMGDLYGAVKEFQEALKLDSDDSDLHYDLGMLYKELDDFDNAIIEFREVLRLDPNRENIHVQLGDTNFGLKAFDAAIEEYLEALRIDPNNTMVHNDLGLAYHAQGKLEEAVEEYKEALRIDSRDAASHLYLGRVYKVQKKMSAAIEEFQKGLKSDPSPFEKCMILEELNKEEALKEWKALLFVAQKVPHFSEWARQAQLHIEFLEKKLH
jgi:tetratricopeptide (TPR) repeat protein/very-short-patch-repair endonuclease